MKIISIDKDTVKEVQETIIDLKPLREKLNEINSEISEIQKQSDTIHNDMKDFEIRRLENEKKELEDKLTAYGVK